MRAPHQLGWYRYLVRNRTVLGSLFTLVHLPFMVAFISLTAMGLLPLGRVDLVIFTLSAAAVALVLYGEHLLDDTIGVGKPWDTALSDRALWTLAVAMFIGAIIVGAWASQYLGSPIPLVGVMAGIAFSTLYGLEVWKFHSVVFGAIGMGAIPPFSYLAQTISLRVEPDALMLTTLLVFGSACGYVMLATYENTKTDRSSWDLLAVVFVLFYSLALLSLFRSL